MPKCVQCDSYVHPDYSVVVDEDTNACKCAWCYTGKKELTIEDEEGVPQYTITKKEAVERYKRYIQDLKESDKIQKIMMKGQENPFKV